MPWRRIHGSYLRHRSTGRSRGQAVLGALGALWHRRNIDGQKRASRLLMIVTVGLCVVLIGALAFKLQFGTTPLQTQRAPLPQIIRGASDPTPQTQIIRAPSDPAISPSDISIVDGDTIRARGRTIRLVGFDTPEVGLLATCERERDLAQRAALG